MTDTTDARQDGNWRDEEERKLLDMLTASAKSGSVEAIMFLLVNRHGYRTIGEPTSDL